MNPTGRSGEGALPGVSPNGANARPTWVRVDLSKLYEKSSEAPLPRDIGRFIATAYKLDVVAIYNENSTVDVSYEDFGIPDEFYDEYEKLTDEGLTLAKLDDFFEKWARRLGADTIIEVGDGVETAVLFCSSEERVGGE